MACIVSIWILVVAADRPTGNRVSLTWNPARRKIDGRNDLVRGKTVPEKLLEQGAEVLTLEEAAAFLRVPEASLTALAVKNAVPAQEIAGEWRFLRRALVDWLRYGSLYRELRDFTPWVFGFPPNRGVSGND